jgi:hypothetical protein
VYPQAFDEDFHFGLIQFYSQHLWPFLTSQPKSADAYGAVTRDPSFLFHYLMSFPYRVITLFTHDQTIQVIILRFIDIALFTSGLVLFRKLLRRTGMSDVAVNMSILLTALVPVAPQLAGQINYDDLLIPMTAWACLLTFNLIDQLVKRRFTIQSVLAVATVCLLSSMVKYEFAPIFLAIVIFFAVFSWRRLNGHWTTSWRQACEDWKKANVTKWLIVAAFIATSCLFIGRDVVNVVEYHTIAPDCSKVLSVKECSAYYVWIHDYKAHKDVVKHVVRVDPNPLGYLFEWVYWLWYRLFFAINGPKSSYENYPPLPLPAAAFAFAILLSIVALIARGRKTFAGKPYLTLLGLITMVYLVTLLADGYLKFLSTGVLELMNGRYLFPILLPGAAVAFAALRQFTRKWSSSLRYGIVVVLLVCSFDGGGFFTFISRSNDGWYWKNIAVQRVNDDTKKVLEPLLLDGSRHYSSKKWFFN